MGTTSKAEAKGIAAKALEELDCATLYRLFQEREDDLQTIIAGVGAMIPHGNTQPLPRPVSDDSIQAMRDVALAAIQLARDVAIQKVIEEPCLRNTKGSGSHEPER